MMLISTHETDLAMTLARELAKRIVATAFDRLTEQAIRYAKIGVLDALAESRAPRVTVCVAG